MPPKRKLESNAEWWRRKNQKYLAMREEFKKAMEKKEEEEEEKIPGFNRKIHLPPVIEKKVVAFDIGDLWNEACTEKINWTEFFSYLPEVCAPFFRSRPDLYYRLAQAEEIPRGVSYLQPVALMTRVNTVTFAVETVWRKPELRMQNKDFAIECRWEHRETRGLHYLAFTQFSIFFGKDFPMFVCEVLIPSVQIQIRPESSVVLTGGKMRPEDLNIFLDDLMAVYFNETNPVLAWDELVCFNAIMNTVRLQVHVEAPWINFCWDCLRLYHDVGLQTVYPDGTPRNPPAMLCPYCSPILQ